MQRDILGSWIGVSFFSQFLADGIDQLFVICQSILGLDMYIKELQMLQTQESARSQMLDA